FNSKIVSLPLFSNYRNSGFLSRACAKVRSENELMLKA
ncbi:MAG: hypothetical protein ACI9F1_000198, partial [Colwellia sp.]